MVSQKVSLYNPFDRKIILILIVSVTSPCVWNSIMWTVRYGCGSFMLSFDQPSGSVILFVRAYLPTCAHSDHYSRVATVGYAAYYQPLVDWTPKPIGCLHIYVVCGDKHKSIFGYWVAQYGLNPTRRHNHGVMCYHIVYSYATVGDEFILLGLCWCLAASICTHLKLPAVIVEMPNICWLCK